MLAWCGTDMSSTNQLPQQRHQTPAQTAILSVPSFSLVSPQPWVTCETVPSSLTWTLRRSGWKSLVTIVPGAITRCFSGRSRFAKFCGNVGRSASRSLGLG